jgi:DNA-directed RNA polymerase specialized sigma24 family protein
VETARLFEELRPGAFAVAYRMLGSVSEAEDVVQEAFLRLHRALREGERLASPRWSRGCASTSSAPPAPGGSATWGSGCPSRW